MTPRRTALTAAALVTPALIAAMLLVPAPASADSDKPAFSLTGRYSNGGSEVSAVLGDRMYVINGLGIDIVDISNPSAPTLIRTVPLGAYGGAITSVATSKRHVAVAVPKAAEGNAKGDQGTVVILDPQGTVLATALVGALPDMVTFDEDGERLLVANEGEPVSYTPKVDPEGSVSIISLRGLDKGEDRCEVDDDDREDDDDRQDEDDDREDEGDENENDREDESDRDDDRRPAAQDREDDDRQDGARPQQATQDDEDEDDRDTTRGTRSRKDDDRKDNRRPAASPVVTPPAAATAVPVLPAADMPSSDDKACDDDDRKGSDDRDDDSRKDRPSTTPSAGTPTAAATPAVTAVLPAAPVVLTATTVGFSDFNVGGTRTLDPAVRIFGPGATVAQDLEPEYITVAGDRAFVTLQENNAIAEIDIKSASVVAIRPLALKDHSTSGNGLDPSDRDKAVLIAPWAVTGTPMPDALDSFTVKGRTYLITANEGDARSDWKGFVEDARIKDLKSGSGLVDGRTVTLDPAVVASLAALGTNGKAVSDDTNLGRLKITTAPGPAGGDTDADGDIDQLRTFGTRSVTIWSTDGALVWDSGDQIEQAVNSKIPGNFNTSNDDNVFDGRSDDKGPEPEGVVVGKVDGRTLAFVGLERPGGFVVFDLSDPSAPKLVEYVTNRDFTADPKTNATDSGPEVLRFVPAEDSPSGEPLVVVSNEISGTVAIWSVED